MKKKPFLKPASILTPHGGKRIVEGAKPGGRAAKPQHYTQIVSRMAKADGIPYGAALLKYDKRRDELNRIAHVANRANARAGGPHLTNRAVADIWNRVRGVMGEGSKAKVREAASVRFWAERYGMKGDVLKRVGALEKEIRRKAPEAAPVAAMLLLAAAKGFRKGSGVPALIKELAKGMMKQYGLLPGLYFTMLRSIYA